MNPTSGNGASLDANGKYVSLTKHFIATKIVDWNVIPCNSMVFVDGGMEFCIYRVEVIPDINDPHYLVTIGHSDFKGRVECDGRFFYMQRRLQEELLKNSWEVSPSEAWPNHGVTVNLESGWHDACREFQDRSQSK